MGDSSVAPEEMSKDVPTDIDELIFEPSDIPGTPLAELVEELSRGLASEQAGFVAEAAAELATRLSPRRFAHSISVSRTAAALADVYGSDRALCVCAGLVHDWDKCYKGQEVFDRAEELGMELPDGYRNMEALFHAATGANALEMSFPRIDPRIIQAVSRHTSGAVDMSDIDMIIYISDMIEPLRKFDWLKPLRDMVGSSTLRDLFAECYRSTISNLVKTGRFMHPDSAVIWNAYVANSSLKSRLT